MKIDNMREEHQEKLIKDAEKLAAQQAEEEKKNETKPATNPMFEASNSNLDVDIPDLSFPSFE